MIEERNAHLERYRHAGAVDLGEDVVGKISDSVEILHALERIRQSAGDASIDLAFRLLAVIDQRLRIVPGADQAAIAVLIPGTEELRGLVHFLDGKARAPLRRQQAKGALPQHWSRQAQTARQSTADRRRHLAGSAGEVVPCVAGEQLVATVAGQ